MGRRLPVLPFRMARIPVPAPPLPAAALVLPLALVGIGGGFAPPASADPPGVVAREYLDAVESLAWPELAARVHPEALASFRRHLDAILHLDGCPGVEDGPTEPEVLEALTGVRSVEAYCDLEDRALLVRVLEAVRREAPGLVNAWTERSTRVVGTVPEGDGLAHAVYWLHWDLDGAEPQIKVMTLAREEGAGWRVERSEELRSLSPALTPILRRLRGGRSRGPGGGSPGLPPRQPAGSDSREPPPPAEAGPPAGAAAASVARIAFRPRSAIVGSRWRVER